METCFVIKRINDQKYFYSWDYIDKIIRWGSYSREAFSFISKDSTIYFLKKNIDDECEIVELNLDTRQPI